MTPDASGLEVTGGPVLGEGVIPVMTVDAEGAVWVTDNGNGQVLRLPEADVTAAP